MLRLVSTRVTVSGPKLWQRNPVLERRKVIGKQLCIWFIDPPAAEAQIYGWIISAKPLRNSVVRNVLRGAWDRFSSVRMQEVDDHTLSFEFGNARDRDQVMDLSPWSVQGHCLNLRACSANMSLEENKFDKLEIWIQVHGLSLDVSNAENARQIGNNLGKCIVVESEQLIKNCSFLRIKTEININEPLQAGFGWVNDKGEEKWATIKYERLSDFCYSCGRLGYTSQHCDEEVIMAKHNPGHPLYGPWLQGTIPSISNRWYNIGGGHRPPTLSRQSSRKSWKQVMNEARDGGGEGSSSTWKTMVNSTERRRSTVRIESTWIETRKETQTINFMEAMQSHNQELRNQIGCTGRQPRKGMLLDLNQMPEDEEQGTQTGVSIPWTDTHLAQPPVSQSMIQSMGLAPRKKVSVPPYISASQVRRNMLKNSETSQGSLTCSVKQASQISLTEHRCHILPPDHPS